MPGYRGHMIGGALVSILLLYLFGEKQSYVTMSVLVVAALAGSLFPDIDTKSKGQKWFYRLMIPLLFLFLIMKKYLFFTVTTFLLLGPLVVNHRGLFHRLWFIVLLTSSLWGVAAWYFPNYSSNLVLPLLFFLAGATSHLILDFGFRRTFKVHR